MYHLEISIYIYFHLFHFPSQILFSCNSHPSLVFSRLLTHAFCHLWWRLVRIWIYLVRAFRAYIHAHSVSLQPKGYLSKTLYDKKGLAGEYQGGLWWMAWWTLEPSLNSYFGFSKSIVIILSFIKPWIYASNLDNRRFYARTHPCDSNNEHVQQTPLRWMFSAWSRF